MTNKYYDVAPVIPLPPAKDTFTYRSQEKLAPGAIVRVPFGRRQVRGVVVQRVLRAPSWRTKDIARVYAASLAPGQLAFGARISALSHGGLGYTMRIFFPSSLQKPFAVGTALARGEAQEAACIGPLNNRQAYIRRRAQAAVRAGRQALIIVPERWMTGRFPFARPYHAAMKSSVTTPLWQDVAAGKPVIVAGTQKALFLPWQKLSFIVVDEEQLSTHKLWDAYPRGDNRRLAKTLAQLQASALVFAGPIPSVRVYSRLQTKTLSFALKEPQVPRCVLVPVSYDDRRHGRLIPADLAKHISSWKKNGERVLLLHNEKDSRVAKALRSLRLLKKDQIIIGTSALFAKVGDERFDRVVWMFPENTLSFPDFRSRESAYAMLARLHGLLARPKPVFLVTRQSQFVEESLSGTMKEIYGRCLAERKMFFYPPFSDMVRLTFKGKNKQTAEQKASRARTQLEKNLAGLSRTRILGPYASGKRGALEFHLLLLGEVDRLAAAYASVAADVVDADPQQVL